MKKSTKAPANPTASLAEFQPNPDNPQKYGDDDIAALVESIRKEPRTLGAAKIAFCTDYTATNGASYAGRRVVIAGNKRLQALQQIAREGGLRDPGDASAWLVSPQGDAPAAWFFDLTPLGPDARRHWLLESNIGRGEWDAEKLLAQFARDELADHFDADALQEILDAAETDEAKDGKTDADSVPSAPETPVSKRGEVYQCGEHRLMCGDSTSAADVTRLMGGGKADMVFTDPPYNVAIGDRNKAINEEGKKRGQKNLGGRIEQNILGDSGMSDEECGEKLWRPAFQNAADNSADYAAIYVTMPQGGTHMMMMMMMMRGSWQVKHELMWLKNQPTFSMGRLDYDYKHEPICYGWKKTHRFFGNGDFTKSVWEFDKPAISKLHPTMKPVALIENALKNSSQINEIILDLFGGSGTTMIAAESLGRKARLMELDPHYCDVIRRRWAEFVHGEGCDWQALTPKTK